MTRENPPVAEASWIRPVPASLMAMLESSGDQLILDNPRTLSTGERERLARRYMAELIDLFGPDSDVPGPDVNTGPQVMAWMLDTYVMHKRVYLPGVITGKACAEGFQVGKHVRLGRHDVQRQEENDQA